MAIELASMLPPKQEKEWGAGGEAGKGRKEETREAGRGGGEGRGREGRVKMGKTFVLFIKLIGFGY